MKETTLNVNSFNKNITLTGETAILRQLFNLLVMKKGTDPLNLDKGCDLTSYYYSFKNNSELQILEQTIKDQITKYTNYSLANVTCKAIKKNGDWILHVFLSIIGMNDTLVASTNGLYTQFTKLDSFSKQISNE